MIRKSHCCFRRTEEHVDHEGGRTESLPQSYLAWFCSWRVDKVTYLQLMERNRDVLYSKTDRVSLGDSWVYRCW